MNRDLILKYIDEYLENPTKLKLLNYTLHEDFAKTNISVTFDIDGERVCVESSGVGLVDAGFNALSTHFCQKYPSIKNINLSDIYFRIDRKQNYNLNLKSKTILKLEFENDKKNKVLFQSKTSSIGLTSINVLCKAFEFYVNCENLFKRIKFLIEDASKRNRTDMSAKYSYILSKVVEVTTYKDV